MYPGVLVLAFVDSDRIFLCWKVFFLFGADFILFIDFLMPRVKTESILNIPNSHKHTRKLYKHVISFSHTTANKKCKNVFPAYLSLCDVKYNKNGQTKNKWWKLWFSHSVFLFRNVCLKIRLGNKLVVWSYLYNTSCLSFFFLLSIEYQICSPSYPVFHSLMLTYCGTHDVPRLYNKGHT